MTISLHRQLASVLMLFAFVFIVSPPAFANGSKLSEPSNWAGFYIGGNAGYGFTDVDNLSLDLDGFAGGGHAGFNFVSGNIVYGLEGDISCGW